jgi:membrane fusion protein, multidrug efflux system
MRFRSTSLLLATAALLVMLSGCSREIDSDLAQAQPWLAAPLVASEPGAEHASVADPAGAPDRGGDAAEIAQNRAHRELPSVLYSEHDADIGPRVAGVIASIAVELGDRVRTGELLASLRDDHERASLEAARATLELASLEHERASRLREQGLVTQAEIDQTTFRLRSAQAALKEAEVRLEYTRIRAPFAGAISRRFVRIGQTVEEGAPLFRVTALQPLRAMVRVPELSAHELVPGRPLRLRGPAGQEVLGRIARVAPAVDPLSGTVEVLVDVPDPAGLRPGSAVVAVLPSAAGPR